MSSVASRQRRRRAAALTHRLLAFSRRQALEPKVTDVNQLVRDMADLIRQTVAPSIEAQTVLEAGIWMTRVDQSQLENALLNLCINARDAMPDGGRIVIATENRWLDARAAAAREIESGQYVLLSVSDTGAGMSPAVANHAFDPFFTAKPIGKGTGLGLSMIYGFARQSAGSVHIDSEEGRGTTVCIYLPRANVHPDLPAPVGHVPARDRRNESLLIIDGDMLLRALMAEVLCDVGYTVLDASDGTAATRILRSGEKIDLLITDTVLPGNLDGRRLAEAAMAFRPALKTLFMSGHVRILADFSAKQ